MTGIGIGYQQTYEQLKDFFASRQPILLKKGEVFLDYGEPNRKLGLLLSGLLYASYAAESGQEWISRFFYCPDNGIISSHETFMTGKESTEIIRAYEDSEIIFIDRAEYDELLNTHPDFHRLARILAEESYVQALRRVHSLQSLTASQRVKMFVKEHSEIVSRVQRQHVASYLGIHRNIFTRILNKI